MPLPIGVCSRRSGALRVLFITMTVALSSACSYLNLVSVAANPSEQPNGLSIDPATSQTGRYVAFASEASNLVTNDNNAYKDIFLRDNQLGITELISKSMAGNAANGTSGQPDLSADARYVVYWSFADDIVASDTNSQPDVFLYDRQTGITERVSVDSNEVELSGSSLGGSVSDNGRYVVFYTTAAPVPNDTNALYDVYKRDRQAGTTTLISTNLSGNAAGSCFDPVIARDGGTIAFWSATSDISSGDTNNLADVFLLSSFLPVILNATSGGNGNSYTGDLGTGSFPTLAFYSSASNLVAADTNGVADIFVDEWTGVSYARRRITDGDGGSTNPVLAVSDPIASTTVAFNSSATNLQEPGAMPLDVNGVTDVYVWKRDVFNSGGVTRLMSQSPDGQNANARSSGRPGLSSDGQAIAFASAAENLGFSDSNGVEDVFLRPTRTPEIIGVRGTLQVGQTSVLKLSGTFWPGVNPDSAYMFGKGVVAVTVDSVSFTTMFVTVQLDNNAKPGSQDLWVVHSAPELGMPAPLGSADKIAITITP